MDKNETVSYVAPEAPGFQFRIGTKRLRFRNGVLELTDPDLIKQLDELIETLSTFKRLVKKVDKKAALQLMNAHKDSRGGAVKGGITAQGIIDSQKTPTTGDAALNGLSVEQQEKLIDDVQQDSGLNITKLPAETPPHQPLKEHKPASLLNLGKTKSAD